MSNLKIKLEHEKEELKQQFMKYCEEIKHMYDKEKTNLKAKITELTYGLNTLEREKETSSDVIHNSLREVNQHYSHKIDQLQKELLDTRTEASTRLINLTKELNTAQSQLKNQDETIGGLKAKLKDVRYKYDISQKAATYRLEKSE